MSIDARRFWWWVTWIDVVCALVIVLLVLALTGTAWGMWRGCLRWPPVTGGGGHD